MFFGDKDVFVNIVGGMNVNNPSIDLAVCAAIKSSVKDNILSKDQVYFGEVGLTGEIRDSWGVDSVINEASSGGYKSAIVGRSRGTSKKGFSVKKVVKISSI
jgi:DNA repair protein RadA/Sms